MAKNYTFNEAVAIIAEGKDLDAITDIGRRYPVLLHKVAVVAAKAGDEFVDLMNFMPAYLTANKVNAAIKSGAVETTTEDDETDDEAETTDATPKAEETEAVQWNESMSAKQLWDLLGKADKRKLAKSTKKVDLIDACKQAFGGATSDDEDAEEAEAETEEATGPYDGKSAMELFKECKARKLKVVPKKPAKYYIDLLTKDDAAKANSTESDEESDEDDWSDETEETPKKEKPAKKPVEKTDEDDDWDI